MLGVLEKLFFFAVLSNEVKTSKTAIHECDKYSMLIISNTMIAISTAFRICDAFNRLFLNEPANNKNKEDVLFILIHAPYGQYMA